MVHALVRLAVTGRVVDTGGKYGSAAWPEGDAAAEPHRSRAAHVAAIEPFANEGNRLGIGGLTVENRTDRVSVYGGLDLTRDKPGLAHARELQTLLDRVVRALEAEKDLPDEVAPAKRPTRVENPFA